jgi:hypothetical protein
MGGGESGSRRVKLGALEGILTEVSAATSVDFPRPARLQNLQPGVDSQLPPVADYRLPQFHIAEDTALVAVDDYFVVRVVVGFFQ